MTESDHSEVCPVCGGGLPGNLVVVDLGTNTMIAGGVAIKLRPREAEVAFALRRRAPNYLATVDLAEQVYASEYDGTRAVMDLIWTLRKKIAEAGMPIEIGSERGLGYRWIDRSKPREAA